METALSRVIKTRRLKQEPIVPNRLELDGADYRTLSRHQKTLGVSIPSQELKRRLLMLIDSTGVKVQRQGEGHARKHSDSRRHVRCSRSS